MHSITWDFFPVDRSLYEVMKMALSPFPYSDNNKRYHTFDYAMRQRFGKKVAMVPLDAGLTCPNRDGTKGIGGCIYCSGRGAEIL